MNIIVGASGQVGSAIASALLRTGKPVKGITKDPQKAAKLESKGALVEIADFFNAEALSKAFQGGHTVFLLTPENPASQNVLADTETILTNYREAIRHSGIKRIVGLSSMGAQHKQGTGNLEMSYRLEHSFQDLAVKQTFIRPAYYYSNWMGYLEIVKEQGVLPSFFPVQLKIPMAAPKDVAEFIAQVIADENANNRVYEVIGPEYSPADIADRLSSILNRKVVAQQVPQSQWKASLQQVGFSDNAADNLIQMTQAVINGKTTPEHKKSDWITLPTTFEEYLKEHIH